jgi:hypothetical protein
MLIKVKVTPNSPKNEVIEYTANFIRVKIAANPEKGKANKELIKFLADYFHIPKSAITIKSGETKKEKYLEIKK